MADKRITDLPANTVTASNDVMELSDVSANQSQKITLTQLAAAVATYLASGALPIAALPSGVPVQVANFQTGTMATGTTLVPYDNTIPQSNEGDQYMSLVFTPKSATNTLIIEASGMFYWSGTGNFAMALFKDADASAMAASSVGGSSAMIPLRHKMTAGTTSPITFKVRAGAQGSGTTTFNGLVGTAYLGGVLASSITITEIKV